MGEPSSDLVLARRPPLDSLLAVVVRAGFVVGAAFVFRWFYADREKLLFAKGEGGIVVIRVALLAVLAFFAARSLFAIVRVIQRWTTCRARISIDRGVLIARVPPRRSWFPFERAVVETRIPLAELRALRIGTGGDVALEIVGTEATVAIAPRLFAVGAYTIDARIREHTGPGEWPHPLAPVEPLGAWVASTAIRIAMPIVGAALLVAGTMLTIVLEGQTRLPLIPFALGLALLILTFTYRGVVVIDPRGVFFERGGRTSHIAWSELHDRTPILHNNFAGMWRDLEVKSAKTSSGGAVRLSINQILWLGFPLVAIDGEIRAHARTFR